MKRSRYGLFRSRFQELISFPPLPECLEICRAFNAAHPIGQPVKVLPYTGRAEYTKTRRRAEVHERRPVIWVEGAAGYVELHHVRAL